MLYPKLELPMADCQVIQQKNEDSRCNAIRIAVLIWAFLRLAVSMLWTGTLMLGTIGLYLAQHSGRPLTRYFFGPFVIFLQLIEFGMLVTFIVAGFKKSASLYLVYYWYCIVTLVIYIIAVTVCLSLGYESGHYFGELYIFYNIYNIFDLPAVNGNEELAFLITSLFDFGFEILLIFLIKRLINNYKHYGNVYVASENV